MKKIINWLVVSSANPEKVSLTVRGAIVGIIPLIIMTFTMLDRMGIIHISWTEADLIYLAESIGFIISSVLITVGMARKLLFGMKDLYYFMNGKIR
jgi:hypothetical protein